MAVLVQKQDDMINQIDHHVNEAVDFTGAGVEELKKAVKFQVRLTLLFSIAVLTSTTLCC
jgi:t-SNARE complex subunit (syntaxin)